MKEDQHDAIFNIEEAGQIEQTNLKMFELIKRKYGKKIIKIEEEKLSSNSEVTDRPMQGAIIKSLQLKKIEKCRAQERKRYKRDLEKAIATSMMEL